MASLDAEVEARGMVKAHRLQCSARLPVDLVPPRRQQLVRAQVRLPSLGISTELIDQMRLEGWGEQDSDAMSADPSVHWGPCRACQVCPSTRRVNN